MINSHVTGDASTDVFSVELPSSSSSSGGVYVTSHAIKKNTGLDKALNYRQNIVNYTTKNEKKRVKS